MKEEIVQFLQCPARDCGGDKLVLQAEQVETIAYRNESAEEVRTGELICPQCDRHYPISEFVPSFEQLFPAELLSEAEYWGKWYSFMWDRGYLGFFDLREPVAPLISEGIEVPDPASANRDSSGGTHSIIADHRLFQNAEWMLDIGCGTGWSSLYFARRGHKVIAFDPSAANMRLAKRYAISQGEYIEYLASGLGFLSFHPDVFDAAVGLHSIHHVPDLRNELAIVRQWIKDGGGFGVDEHIRNNEWLTGILGAMRNWAQEEVFPALRTITQEELTGIPKAEPSALEGAGSENVIQAFVDNFTLEVLDSRYIGLDTFSFLYYLSRERSREAYNSASDIVGLLYQFMRSARPYETEYVTMIGQKSAVQDAASSDLAREAIKLSSGNAHSPEAAPGASLGSLTALLAAKDQELKQLDAWAHSLERSLIAERRKSLLQHIQARVARSVRRRKRK